MRTLLLLCVAGALVAEVTQDEDGRIPWRETPPEVGVRDRWRYLPPERMVPGGFIDRFGVTTFAFPIVFSEEAIGTGAGVGVVDTDFRAQGRQEAVAAFASLSSEGQRTVDLVWRRALLAVPEPAGGVFLKESANLGLMASYRRTLTRRFFGLGPDTTPDDETSYTDEVGALGAVIEGEPIPAARDLTLRAGAHLERRHLEDGRVPHRPSTRTVHPDLTTAADDRTDVVTTVGATWDSRDSRANPYHGGSLGLSADSWTSHGDGVVATARATWAVAVPSLFHDGGLHDLATRGREENPPTDVLAVGGLAQVAGGEVPFHALPSLGGSSTLRGYLADRFVDRAAWHGSVEWRTWILPRGFAITKGVRIERVGLAPFWDVGTVASRLDRLPSARLHHNPGLGLRFAFERALVLRLDIARSSEQMGVNLDMGMAF